MARKLFHTFAIKLAIKPSKSFVKVSRKCLAVIILHDGDFRAKIRKELYNDNEFLILPLTPKSFDLKHKGYVYSRNKDKNGKHILCIREVSKTKLSPGLVNQYITIKVGCVISGYICRNNNKLYFDYDNFVAFSEDSEPINDINIDDESNLFKDDKQSNK